MGKFQNGTLYTLDGRPLNFEDRFKRGNTAYTTSHGQAYKIRPGFAPESVSTAEYERALAAKNAFPAIIGRW